MEYETPVVILCGGKGTRLKEETEFRPKPLVRVGAKPILWHIMKTYAHFGFKNFILCLGYKGEMIRNYFLNYDTMTSDFTLNLRSKECVLHNSSDIENWNITFANTGDTANTGARIKRIEKYVKTEYFMLTYGDGVGDVDIAKLFKFHKSHGKIGTVTSVKPVARFGVLEISQNQIVNFKKRNLQHDGWIDGGFFVFHKEMFNYLTDEDDCMLEDKPLMTLARDGEFMTYQHQGFWQCMDTIRQMELLNTLWNQEAPWKLWK